MKNIFMIVLALLLLFGCSGEDNPDIDTTPPTRPVMIPHLGGPGDPEIYLNNAWVELTDHNNGIDTVPDGNMMRIMWEPFIDTDLSHLNIYRYSDVQPDSVMVDQIAANYNDYLDRGPLTERIWYSYYIELFDANGNSAISDTVSYALLAKPYLLNPANGAAVNVTNLDFVWNKADDQTGFYRVLLWNQDRKLLWHQDLYVSTEDNPLTMSFPVIVDEDNPIQSGDLLYWRVDYFDYDDLHEMNMGSKSEERYLFVQ